MAVDLRELREDYAAGRLTLDEFAERVGSVLRDDVAAPLHTGGPFDDHLAHGERLLWVGRPDPTKRFNKADLVLVPFSVVWAGFAFFWEASVIASGAPFFFALFGIPFVLAGLYITVGRFFFQGWAKKRTWYAVTDRRVLRLVHGRSRDDLAAAFIDGLSTVSADVRADGSGSVVFGSAPFGFSDIPHAAYVAELVTQIRQDRPGG